MALPTQGFDKGERFFVLFARHSPSNPRGHGVIKSIVATCSSHTTVEYEVKRWGGEQEVNAFLYLVRKKFGKVTAVTIIK